MRILIIGGGGREHALTWSLARSPQRPELFIAPGNSGTEAFGTNIPIGVGDGEELVRWAVDAGIDLVVVGPEQPLVDGLVDRLEAAGVPAIGPSAAAARLEGSKSFAKDFMRRHGIPTAAYATFKSDDFEAALAYVRRQGAPLVIKANGLAAGKGVSVCMSLEAAEAALTAAMKEGRFGAAGDEVVIEAYMEGEEASVFALTDGTHYTLFPVAQDHKRLLDGDDGPNTGGMGAYAPAPVVQAPLLERIERDILVPTLTGMAADGAPYRGFLYVGLMLTDEGPKVVEYNCRLGDPETQVVLPLLESDLVDALLDVVAGRSASTRCVFRKGAAACVVMASEGYPGDYRKGLPILGIEDAGEVDGVLVFHAGTRRSNGRLCTAGGRVLGVTAFGADLPAALETAYEGVSRITFQGNQFRTDIGRRGLARVH